MRSNETYLHRSASPARPASKPATFKWLLLAQIAVADLVLWFFPGLAIDSFGSFPGVGELRTGVLGLFFSMLFILAMMNSVVSIDRFERLGVRTALAGFLALGSLAFVAGATVSLALASCAAVGLALLLRFRKASCRLGRYPAMLAGLLLAVVALDIVSVSPDGVSLPVAALALALPLVGVAGAFAKRLSHGRSPFSTGDGAHLQDALLLKGMSAPAVRRLMTVLGAFFGVLAVAAALFGVPDALLSTVLAALFVLSVLL